MCEKCGCSELEDHRHGPSGHAHRHHHHDHHDHHDHQHHHEAPGEAQHAETRVLRLELDLLGKNAAVAAVNRRAFLERRQLCLNFVSSPGSGKTTLLERLIRDRSGRESIYVVQGDQATERDADRVRAAGAQAVQINTGTGCHLDATMVRRAVAELSPAPRSLVAIENVGNLVCPALFDLGEQARVALLSVPEGADKPLKYPYLFRSADLVLLNKVDLLPYVDFDTGLFENSLEAVHPGVRWLAISATRGDGLFAFYQWLDALGAGTEPAAYAESAAT